VFFFLFVPFTDVLLFRWRGLLGCILRMVAGVLLRQLGERGRWRRLRGLFKRIWRGGPPGGVRRILLEVSCFLFLCCWLLINSDLFQIGKTRLSSWRKEGRHPSFWKGDLEVEEWEAPLGRSWMESWPQWDWSQPTPQSVLQAWGVEFAEEWMKRCSPGTVEECLRKRDGRL